MVTYVLITKKPSCLLSDFNICYEQGNNATMTIQIKVFSASNTRKKYSYCEEWTAVTYW